MSYSIRRAEPADDAALAELASATFCEAFAHLYPPEDLSHYLSTAYAPAVLRAQIVDTAGAIWLASMADETAPFGYVQAGPCGLPHPDVRAGQGEIKRLYVRRTRQNLGLGRVLLQTALDWLGTRYPGPVWLGVYSANPGAQRLYARYGFAKVGEYDYPVGKTLDREFVLRRP